MFGKKFGKKIGTIIFVHVLENIQSHVGNETFDLFLICVTFDSRHMYILLLVSSKCTF